MSRTPYLILPDKTQFVPVGSTTTKWSDDFGGNALDPNKWEVETDVGGMTYSVSASNLTVNMNTNANAELRFLSREIFTVPFDVTWIATVSQRIADNSIFFEVVEVDPDTGVPVANPNRAGDWSNRASFLVDGTTSNTYRMTGLGDASSAELSVSMGNAVSSAGTVEYLMELRPQDVFGSFVNANSAAGRSGSAGRLSSSCPDPNRAYKLRMRFRNGATAPASNTVVTMRRVLAVDVQEMAVEVASGRGDANANKAIATNIVNTVPLTQTAAGTNTQVHRVIAGTSTNPTVVKASEGRLVGGVLRNRSAAERFFKLYNRNTAPNPATDIPVLVLPLAPNETLYLVDILGPVGHWLGNGLTYTITTGIADNDTGVTAANDVFGTLVFA